MVQGVLYSVKSVTGTSVVPEMLAEYCTAREEVSAAALRDEVADEEEDQSEGAHQKVKKKNPSDPRKAKKAATSSIDATSLPIPRTPGANNVDGCTRDDQDPRTPHSVWAGRA